MARVAAGRAAQMERPIVFMEGRMRNHLSAWLVLALILTTRVGTPAEDSSKQKGKAEIDRLIEKLGQAALDALGKALGSGDLEVRRRASRLIERISDRLARTDVKEVPPPKG